MKSIRLKIYGITVNLGPKQSNGHYAGGTITSNLKDDNRLTRWNAALDAVESLILGHACSGIDIAQDAYIIGIESAIDAIVNHLD